MPSSLVRSFCTPRRRSFRWVRALLIDAHKSTSDLYRIVSELAEKGVSFKVVDDPTIETSTRTGKLVMGVLALIAEFENDIRRERQMDGIAKAQERGVRFGRKPQLVPDTIELIKELRSAGRTIPAIMKETGLSKASVYRALAPMIAKARDVPREQKRYG